jgi:hypothetical protein
MIRIQVDKVSVPSSSGIKDFDKTMYAQASNAAAQGWADEMKKNGLEKKACPDHPNHSSTVVIRATGTKELMKVEKRNFCCCEFDKSITFTIKR